MLDGILLAFARAASIGQAEFNVLDLKCRDGQVAKLLRTVATRIDGVEVDPASWYEMRGLYDSITLKAAREVSLAELDNHWFIVGRGVLEELTEEGASRLITMLGKAHSLAYFEIDYLKASREQVGLRWPALQEIYSEPDRGAWVLWP